jgi:hypothetical protein
LCTVQEAAVARQASAAGCLDSRERKRVAWVSEGSAL